MNDAPFRTPGRTPPPADAPQDQDIASLLRQLMGQGTHLAEQQIALLKAEVRDSTTSIKAAVGAIAGAAVVGIAGLGVLLMGLAYLLADAIDHLGLATLIVGVVTLIIAFILYRSAMSRMGAADLAPERTQQTLERTPAALRGDLNPEQRS